jgi:crotonobetainyl-CoA:carnitine CoA-transferase CaiB-like acyl-CoA transferase
MVAPYQVFPTRDGELMIAGGNDRLFSLVCDVLGMSELVSDARFLTNPDRVRNREELVTLLSTRLRERDTTDWQEQLTAAGVPAAPVADVADIVHSPQTAALEMIQAVPHPRIPQLRLAPLPLSFDGERAQHRSSPPLVGEHTADVLTELGYSEGEIGSLATDGVIRLGAAD